MTTRSLALTHGNHGNPLQGWPPAPVALAGLCCALGAAADLAPGEPALGYEGAFPFLAGAAAEASLPADPQGERRG